MSVLSDLAHVVALAALTEDRNPAEQRALEQTALRLDRDRNRYTASNGRFDWEALPVACSAPWHRGGGRCRTCRTVDPLVQLNVHPFSDSAKAEPLVDEDGWSIAARYVHPDA